MPEIMEWIKQEGIAEGIERGHREAALQNARKMREHGIAWDIVTDVTGIKPEDLKTEAG
jgi:predicted transposase YdaD